jgi:hypothetical protein
MDPGGREISMDTFSLEGAEGHYWLTFGGFTRPDMKTAIHPG